MTVPNVMTANRNQITAGGASEFDTQQNQPALLDLSEQIQTLKREISAAKLTALKEVEEKYAPQLLKLEKSYMFLFKMAAAATGTVEG